jgi:hypothetical protein
MGRIVVITVVGQVIWNNHCRVWRQKAIHITLRRAELHILFFF